MKLNKFVTLLSAISLSLGIAQNAFAADFNYSQSIGTVLINSTDFSDTTTLGWVKATCPAAGYLVAQGSAGILLTPVVGDTTGVVQGGISITTDNVAPYAANPNHYNSIVFNAPVGAANNSALPTFIQRVDVCKAGQAIGYRFVGWHEYAGAGSYAFQPRLVVQFFDTKI